MDNKQQLYLKKIQNDVDERLYDLLIEHLQEVHKILPKNQENKDNLKQLNSILFPCLEQLKKESNKFNYLQHYRFSIKIINILLSYKPDEGYLKNLKLDILNKFSSKTLYEKNGKLPLRSQISELRITFDCNYLIHLLEKQFIPNKNWDKAMYCLIAIELVEPDHDDIAKYKQIIEKHLFREELESVEFEEPKESMILLDTNIILSKVLHDVDDYKIPHHNLDRYNEIMEKWGNNNKFVITKSVKEELEENLDYTTSKIEKICAKSKRFDSKYIIETIEKRFNHMVSKYYMDFDVDYDLDDIEEFYSNYLGNLYEITLEKIAHKRISKKLKKLASRDSLLPEYGDLHLLKEAIKLKERGYRVEILSNDKDLYLFNKEIYNRFGIKIHK